MTYQQLFRQMGRISRQAMMYMNQEASPYQLDHNLFLIVNRIVEHPGIHPKELSQLLKIDKTTLSRALRNLEKRDLLYKVTHSQNKKFKELYPTQQAIDHYYKLITIEEKYIQQAFQTLSPDEYQQLATILTKIETSQF